MHLDQILIAKRSIALAVLAQLGILALVSPDRWAAVPVVPMGFQAARCGEDQGSPGWLLSLVGFTCLFADVGIHVTVQYVFAVRANFGAGVGAAHWTQRSSTVLNQNVIFDDGAGAEGSSTDSSGGEGARALEDSRW